MMHCAHIRLRAAALALVFALCSAGFTCDSLLGPDPAVRLSDADEGSRIVVGFGRDTSDLPRDDWGLVSGRVAHDSLELVVRYAGGCRDHRFWLLAVDGWGDLPDQGITPKVEVPLVLAHDADGDTCEALITDTLRFDLDPLREAYREDRGDGPATLLLRLMVGRDGSAIHTFDWFIDPRTPS